MNNNFYRLSVILLLVSLVSGCAVPAIVKGITEGVQEGKRLNRELCAIDLKDEPISCQ